MNEKEIKERVNEALACFRNGAALLGMYEGPDGTVDHHQRCVSSRILLEKALADVNSLKDVPRVLGPLVIQVFDKDGREIDRIEKP